jgi:hypothetical protein
MTYGLKEDRRLSACSKTTLFAAPAQKRRVATSLSNAGDTTPQSYGVANAADIPTGYVEWLDSLPWRLNILAASLRYDIDSIGDVTFSCVRRYAPVRPY